MEADTVDATAARDGAFRRYDVLVYAYFAAMTAATLVLAWRAGPLVGVAVVLGAHVLLHVPAFAVRSELTMLTDESPDAAYREFAALRNPLTTLWLQRADGAEGPTDGGDASATFRLSGPAGLSSRRHVVSVDERSDRELHLEIRRARPVLDAHIRVEADEDGTAVTVEADRTRVHAFSLFLMWAVESAMVRHFAAHGYEVAQEDATVRLRLPVER